MAKGLTAMGAEAPLTGQMTSVSADVTQALKDLVQQFRKENEYRQCKSVHLHCADFLLPYRRLRKHQFRRFVSSIAQTAK